MTDTTHWIAAPVLQGVGLLGEYQPADPADLAHLLRSLADVAGDDILTRLQTALDTWAEHATGELWPDAELIATWLQRATEHLSSVAEALDHARQATGHYYANGSTR